MPLGRFPINMNPKANYVGQGSAYDRLLHGDVLTDAKINAYIRQGRYGREAQARLERLDRLRRTQRHATKPEPRLTVDQLLARYGI